MLLPTALHHGLDTRLCGGALRPPLDKLLPTSRFCQHVPLQAALDSSADPRHSLLANGISVVEQGRSEQEDAHAAQQDPGGLHVLCQVPVQEIQF